MIHPEQIDGVARVAYGYFRKKYPSLPEWAGLPESTRIKWRDDAVAADRVRNKITDVPQEQCCFDAVMEYHLTPGETSDEAPFVWDVDKPRTHARIRRNVTLDIAAEPPPVPEVKKTRRK